MHTLCFHLWKLMKWHNSRNGAQISCFQELEMVGEREYRVYKEAAQRNLVVVVVMSWLWWQLHEAACGKIACSCIHTLEKAMHPTPVLLPGKSHGRKPGGLLSMGSHRVGHDWSDLAIAVYIHTRMSIYKTGEHQMSLVDCTNVNFPVLISLVILDVNIGRVWVKDPWKLYSFLCNFLWICNYFKIKF